MHFLGQKNVSDFTKRSFFVYIYIYVGNAFWGGQQKSSFSQKVHFSYIYMLETHFSKCHKNVTLPQIFTFRIYIYMFEMHFLIEKTHPCTQKVHFSCIYTYIYVANSFFGSQNVEKVMHGLIWSGIYRLLSI